MQFATYPEQLHAAGVPEARGVAEVEVRHARALRNTVSGACRTHATPLRPADTKQR
jgi:hypothetical protein